MSNPIAIGFAWRQAFDFPPGFLRHGDTIRADFRLYVGDAAPLARAAVDIEGDRFFLSLTAMQTSGMGSALDSKVKTSVVIERDGEAIAVDAVISVPVVLLPTRATA